MSPIAKLFIGIVLVLLPPMTLFFGSVMVL